MVSVTPGRLTRAIRRFVTVWEVSPEQINDGNCGEFATMVINSLGGQSKDLFISYFALKITPNEDHLGHEWITLNGRHYDAESPEGVDDYRQLPWFLRNLGV